MLSIGLLLPVPIAAAFWSYLNTAKEPYRPGRVATIKELEAWRPEISKVFTVLSSDFEVKDGALCRVNPDGRRVSLTKYDLSDKNGQFRKILETKNGMNVLNTATRAERWKKYHLSAPIQAFAWIMASILMLPFVLVSIVIFFHSLMSLQTSPLGNNPYEMSGVGEFFSVFLFALGALIALGRVHKDIEGEGPWELGLKPAQDYGAAVGKVDEMSPETGDWKPFV